MKIFKSKYRTGQFSKVIPLAHGRPFHLNRGKAVFPPILDCFIKDFNQYRVLLGVDHRAQSDIRF